jgi:hypothetical protein
MSTLPIYTPEFETQSQPLGLSFKLGPSPILLKPVTYPQPPLIFSPTSSSGSIEKKKWNFFHHFQLISLISIPFSKSIALNFIIYRGDMEKLIDPLIWSKFQR